MLPSLTRISTTRKRKRPIQWKSTDGFNSFRAKIEQDLGHKLLIDTKERWLSKKYTITSKPTVQCKYCQQQCTTASIYNIMNHGQNIGCPCRHRSERRPTNQWPCNQQCGNANCTYIASTKSKLSRHISKIRIKCPCCSSDVSFTQQCYFYTHFRSQHKELVDMNGACDE